MAGRPTLYSEELASILCDQVAQGRSVREICRQKGMPDMTTFFRWLAKHESFSQQYARAKQIGLEVWADELMDIADTGANDWMERNDPENPGYQANGEHIQRAKLRIDTRKWILSKLVPKKYGEVTKNIHTGPDGEGPTELVITKRVISDD